MSIKLMSAIWEMEFSPVEKLVFLALADCANDEGLAWPSIATIARKTGAGERTVQRAIRLGERCGIIEREEVKGRGCRYTIHPRHSGTPATKSPVTNKTKTPATVAPHPRHSGTQTIIEPSKNLVTKVTTRARSCAMPVGVDLSIWNDFLDHRKAKRAPLSNTALAAIEREAEKAGWTLDAALSECMLRNWQGFKADWVKENGHNGRTSGNPSDNARRVDGFTAALRHVANGPSADPFDHDGQRM